MRLNPIVPGILVAMRAPRITSAATLASLAAVSLALMLPSGTGAAATQFGSSLAPGPTFGCDAEPTLLGTFFASSKPDCTWWQSGVFGVPSDPRVGSVPVSGTITGVTLLGGSNPAPVRIAVMRQLGTPGAGSDCCFFVTETAPLQPAPNTPTSFPLNIPLAHASVVGGIRADDYIGISPQTGGTAPLRVVGDTNALGFTNFGSVNAAALYPRFGSQPGDAGGGRRELGVTNVEILARWTFCPTGDATCQPGGGGPVPVGPATPALAAKLAQVRSNNAQIKLICQGSVNCEGELSLLSGGGALASKKKKAKKVVSYGKKSYKINAGAKKTLKVKLNKKGKRALRGKKKLKVFLKLAPKNGAATAVKLTLKKKP